MLILLNCSNMFLFLLFSSNLMKDFLVSLQLLAASSSKCCSRRVDRMKQEILSLCHKMI